VGNASYHKSHAALAAFSLFQGRLPLIWLPKYRPFLNPIQRFWLHLKNLVSANQFHLDLGTLDTAIAQAAIALYEPRLVAIFLPPYAPHLNLIERYWRHLKDQACADKLYPNRDALRNAIKKELMRQNDLTNGDRFQHTM
jgi:transposase